MDADGDARISAGAQRLSACSVARSYIRDDGGQDVPMGGRAGPTGARPSGRVRESSLIDATADDPGHRTGRRHRRIGHRLVRGTPDPVAGRDRRPHRAPEGVADRRAGGGADALVGGRRPGHRPLRRPPVGVAADLAAQAGQEHRVHRAGQGSGADRRRRRLHRVRAAGVRDGGGAARLPRHGPGTVGTDVQQLEAGLLRYGFDPGPIDGVYDQQTEAAVAAWYQAAGYSPFGPTDEQLAASRTAQGDHFGAQTDLLTAKESLATAQGQLATAQQQAAGARVAAAGAPAAEAAAQATYRAGQGRGAGRRHHQDRTRSSRHGRARRRAEGAGRRPDGEAEAHPGGAGRARGRRPGRLRAT